MKEEIPKEKAEKSPRVKKAPSLVKFKADNITEEYVSFEPERYGDRTSGHNNP